MDTTRMFIVMHGRVSNNVQLLNFLFDILLYLFIVRQCRASSTKEE